MKIKNKKKLLLYLFIKTIRESIKRYDLKKKDIKILYINKL